jgi:hypothetical protein
MPTYTSRLDNSDIDRAQTVNIADVARERGLPLKRSGRELVGPCPRCGGTDRFSISIRKNCFLCRQCFPKGGGAISFVCWLDACDFRRAVATLIGERSASLKSNTVLDLPAKNSADYEHRQHDKARWMWSQRQPISGSIAEMYLREARGIDCPLPPTLAYLPPRKPSPHPAMISAFGICDEVEPGVISEPRHVTAVHLTLLRVDGTGKAEVKPNKIMVGSPRGLPIVLAPPNDLLGLAITEGIEDALSVHQVGLGAWAAGAASFMPKLVDTVPDWIDCVSVFADANEAGETNSTKLAAALNARGIFAEVLPSAGAQP